MTSVRRRARYAAGGGRWWLRRPRRWLWWPWAEAVATHSQLGPPQRRIVVSYQKVARYHLEKISGKSPKTFKSDCSWAPSLASRLLLDTHYSRAAVSTRVLQLQAPAEALHPQNAVSLATGEEGNDCDLASARTNARGHPVRSDYQGSDEVRRRRSTPAFSNAEGDGANVGWCSCPSSMCLPT